MTEKTTRIRIHDEAAKWVGDGTGVIRTGQEAKAIIDGFPEDAHFLILPVSAGMVATAAAKK